MLEQSEAAIPVKLNARYVMSIGGPTDCKRVWSTDKNREITGQGREIRKPTRSLEVRYQKWPEAGRKKAEELALPLFEKYCFLWSKTWK